MSETYTAKTFDLSGLTGISDQTLEMHFKLYAGYVTNTNTYNERIAELIRGGEVPADKMPLYSELKRRLGHILADAPGARTDHLAAGRARLDAGAFVPGGQGRHVGRRRLQIVGVGIGQLRDLGFGNLCCRGGGVRAP